MILYVARNVDGSLSLFTKFPYRDTNRKRWICPIGGAYFNIDYIVDNTFDNLTWEDIPMCVTLKTL